MHHNEDDTPGTLIDSLCGLTDTAVAPNPRSADVKTSRKHHSAFPVAQIVLDPTENYRWGSAAAMKADLAREDMLLEDGSTRSSYQLLRDSIAAIGVEDPVGLVEREDGYHVIYGFTRAAAAKELKLESVPAYVYAGTISSGEVQLLQMRENSPALKRAVNWVAETEMYDSITKRIYLRMLEKNPGVGKQAAASLHKQAHEAACRILGRYPSTMKSRTHFLRVLDPRVITLSREGRLTCTGAMVFHSGNVDHPYTPAFITAVLRHLRGKEGYKLSIQPVEVRKACDAVRAGQARGEEVDDSDGADVGDEPEQRAVATGHTMSRVSRSLAKAADAKGAPGPVQLMRAPEKIRQSSAVLRDLSGLIAWDIIHRKGFGLTTDAKEVEKHIVNSPEWHKVIGIGFGAGDISMPPLMETVLGGRSDEDSEVAQMANQHELTAERYVVAAFVSGFLRQAMASAGVRNLDYDDKGWMLGKTTREDGQVIHHRAVYSDAIQEAVGMPGAVRLLDRAKAAWAKVRPLVTKSTTR